MTRRLLFILAASLVVMLAAGIALAPRGRADTPRLQGTVLNGERAPNLGLADQQGRVVPLRALAGHPVVVTFLESHCTESCPIVAETIERVTQRVRADGVAVPVIAVSTDPLRDTRASVQAFMRTHHLTSNWHYLTGTRLQLTRLWNAYHVYVPPPTTSGTVIDGHTSATFVLDGSARERVLMAGVPDARFLVHDLRLLSGLPLEQSAAGIVPEIGSAAPAVKLQTLSGRTMSLAGERGRVILLNFWATWCPPCRSELPLLSRLAQQGAARGLTVLGVDKLESRGSVQGFVRQMNLSYPVALDGTGEVYGSYQPLAIPATYVVDRRGVIRAIHVGPVTSQWVQHVVDPLLRAAGSHASTGAR